MLTRRLLLAGLAIACWVFSVGMALAKDIVIVASDNVIWLSDGLKNDNNNVLQVPVEEGDVLHFKFSDVEHPRKHGITTLDSVDLAKVQKRGEKSDGQVLQELGEGKSRFNLTITNAARNEEITQLKVLPTFQGTLKLMCSFHGDQMAIALNRAN